VEIWVGVVCLLEEIMEGVDSFHMDTTIIMEGDEGSSRPPPQGNCEERRLLPRGLNHHHGKDMLGGMGRLPPLGNCGGRRLLPREPNHHHCKELWGGMGCLLEEIEEDGDSSHVDTTTIMVRSCGKEWNSSLRRFWRVQTPPMWNHPTSRKGELGRGGQPL
jgi:hypothetical protein